MISRAAYFRVTSFILYHSPHVFYAMDTWQVYSNLLPCLGLYIYEEYNLNSQHGQTREVLVVAIYERNVAYTLL